ncbi:MAG: GDP-L-fucose synthase [Patescibacteria group bacterium]
MNKSSKIYIAGHKGLVGSAILHKFQSEGYKNIITRTHSELDLTRQDLVEDFFNQEKPHYVIIAAARVGGIKANMTYPAEFLYENLSIQNNIIWSALKTGTKKLMFLGSSCIYPRQCPQPMKEEYLLTGKLEPTNEAYAVAKVAGLKLCEYIKRELKKSFISVMPTTIYGPKDHFDPLIAHVVPSLIRRMVEAKKLNSKSIEIWGTGNSRREFLYVDDLADAIYFLMQNYDSKDFINIGVGNDISIKELTYILKDLTGFKGKLVFDRSKPDGMPRKLMDTQRLNKLGWRPKVDLREGLKQTIDWYMETLSKD